MPKPAVPTSALLSVTLQDVPPRQSCSLLHIKASEGKGRRSAPNVIQGCRLPIETFSDGGCIEFAAALPVQDLRRAKASCSIWNTIPLNSVGIYRYEQREPPFRIAARLFCHSLSLQTRRSSARAISRLLRDTVVVITVPVRLFRMRSNVGV